MNSTFFTSVLLVDDRCQGFFIIAQLLQLIFEEAVH